MRYYVRRAAQRSHRPSSSITQSPGTQHDVAHPLQTRAFEPPVQSQAAAPDAQAQAQIPLEEPRPAGFDATKINLFPATPAAPNPPPPGANPTSPFLWQHHAFSPPNPGLPQLPTLQQTPLTLQRDASDTWQEAERRAQAIKEALLGGWVSEDEEAALDQIRGQSVLMLREIRARYAAITDGNRLEADFEEYCSSDEYKEALSWLHASLTIEDRIRTNIDEGWLYNTENETGILEVLRNASQAELAEAALSETVMTLLRQTLNDDEYYEARKLLTPNNMFEVVKERIQKAAGWINDDEDATYSVLLDLTPADRKRLWEQHADIFAFMSEGEKASIKTMCLGTEAEALSERMELATSGWGTDDPAVKLVAGKTQAAAQQEQVIAQTLAAGKNAKGEPLTPEEIASLQEQQKALGGVQQNLLTADRDESGDLKSGSFLEMLHGDVSEAEFKSFSKQIGVSQFELAKQQILDAIGFFNDDEEAIYKAIDEIVGAVQAPAGMDLRKLTPEQRAQLQTQATRDLRQRLMADPAVQAAMKHLNVGETAIADIYASADTYAIAIKKLEDAYYGMDTDEEKIFKLICQMSAADRRRMETEQPEIYTTIVSGGWLSTAEQEMASTAFKTGKIPTEKALDWAFGGEWDGTEDEMLEQTFAAMDDAERYEYRLGYYLHKGGSSMAENDEEKKAEKAALTKFQQLQARFGSELGTDALQKALDQLLGSPTLQELKSEKGRAMAAQIMQGRIGEKGDIREGDTVSSAIMDTFSDAGEVSDQAEVQFESAYKLAMADGKLTDEEFAALAALDANFAEKYDQYVAAVDQVTNIAGTVGAIAAAIVVVVLSGGSGAPAAVALLSKFGVAASTAQAVAATAAVAGVASAGAKVGMSELVGGSHYDAASTEGLKDAAVGFTEGAITVLSAGLAHHVTKMVGLGKAELAGEMAAGILNSSDAAIKQAGGTFARAGFENLIDGFLSGAVGELVMTASDQEVWKKSIWDVVLSFGQALLKGGGIGAVTGAVTGGTLEALGSYVGTKRLQGLMQQLDVAGISSEKLSSLSIDTVKLLGKADAALAAGKLDEAEAAFKALEQVLGPDELGRLRTILNAYHGSAIQDAVILNLKKALAGEGGNAAAHAETAISQIRDFKQLREMVKRGDFGDPALAQAALQEARMKIINDDILKGIIEGQLKAKYPGIKVEFKNLGTPGFGSDCDITIQVSGGASINDDVAASVEGVRDAYKELKKRGLDPDKSLDANFYTELHEGKIAASNAAEADQILQDQSVVSLAEMRMNMSDDQWKAYQQAQLTSLGEGGTAKGLQEQIEADARKRMNDQFQQAEAMAASLKGGDRETLLAARQQALLDAIANGASAQEIRKRMAEIKLLEPDAYGTRAAVEGVVDYQQAIARGTADDYMKLTRPMPDDTAGKFAVHAQEASASLAKMFGHAHGPGKNTLSDVRAMAKYLGRIDHAFFEAGLDTGDELINLKNLLMAAKNGSAPDVDTLAALRKWGSQTNRSHLTDQELCDAWVQEAQNLGQGMVVKLRSAEQAAYAINPKPAAAAPSSPPAPTPGGTPSITPAGGHKPPGGQTPAPATPTPTAGGVHPPPLPGVKAFANLQGRFHVPVGDRLGSAAEGHAILRRLADGDATALQTLGVQGVPPDFNPQVSEWGLGEFNGKFIIIKGNSLSVDWAPFPTVTPLAHSHPYASYKALKGTNGISLTDLLKGGKRSAAKQNKVNVFPSAADVQFCADRGLKHHVVHTPYVHLGNGLVGNPVPGAQNIGVDFEILNAAPFKQIGPTLMQYEAELVAKAGGQEIWRGKVLTIDHPSGGSIVEPR